MLFSRFARGDKAKPFALNYAKVFAHVKESGFDGIVGMEHGNAEKDVDGEQKLIAAYRAVDQV